MKVRYSNVTWPFASLLLTTLWLTSSLLAQEGRANSWLDWAGPSGNFSVAPNPKIDYDQPPKLLWEQDTGTGHSAIVSSEDHLYCQFANGQTEFIRKLELKSGQLIWEKSYPVAYQSLQYPGPHATPAISKSHLITASIDGVIRAVELKSGEIKWSVDMKKRFGMKLPQSGYAASPRLYQKTVIVPTLGDARQVETETYQQPRENAPPGLVALDLTSGRTVWKSESFRSSHASPVPLRVGNRTTICLHGMFELVAVDPDDGATLWRHLLRREASDNVSFTPLWDANRSQLLVSHGYCERGVQAIGIKLDDGKWKTNLNWTNRDMRIVHTNAVIIGDLIVGTNHGASSVLVRIECDSGRTVFRKRSRGKANFARIGDNLISQFDGGILTAGKIVKGELKESFRLRVGDGKSWTAPTISNNCLLCRTDQKLSVFQFQIVK